MANSFCELTAEKGIRLVGKYLARACENGSDMEAREGMMLASTLGGISMLGPFCHLAHDIGRSLGAKFHVPHGNGCAASLPQVLEVIAPAVPEKVKFVTEALGGTVPQGASPEIIGKAAYETAKSLMQRIKLPSLKSYGYSKEELLAAVPDEVVMQVDIFKKLFGTVTSPVPVTKELIALIVSRAYDEN
jgi:alcohol dehydrogenase class IV